jgi:hypothetical protein
LENILKDFEIYAKMPEEVIEKYKDKVPKEMLSLWESYGLGSFFYDYFKVVNPEEYEELLQETSQRYKDGTVLFVTAMGDLIIWADGYVRMLNYRHGILKTIMPSIAFFFNSLESEKFKDDYLKWNPYPRAYEKFGAPNFDECFGYVPILGMGGSEKVENLEKVKIIEHIYLINQFMGPIE